MDIEQVREARLAQSLLERIHENSHTRDIDPGVISRGRVRAESPAVRRDRSSPATVPVTDAGAVRQPKRMARPATSASNLGDLVFGGTTTIFASLIPVVLIAMVAVLVEQSHDAIATYGLSLITSSTWNPNINEFGAAPEILGTLYTSGLALLIAAPVGILVAIFLTEIAPRPIRFWLGFVVELLAAVPSVVFGLWALIVLVPFVAQHIELPIIGRFGNFTLFQGIPIGLSVFSATLILSVMILPTITAITRDVMLAVPNSQRDAMLALGATTWEMVWKVVIPYARSGIIGALILALGRAVGETMAVQMVIGNNLGFSPSLFSQGTTLTATLVNQFPETTPGLFRGALLELALILMLVTIVLNIVARLLVRRMSLSV